MNDVMRHLAEAVAAYDAATGETWPIAVVIAIERAREVTER